MSAIGLNGDSMDKFARVLFYRSQTPFNRSFSQRDRLAQSAREGYQYVKQLRRVNETSFRIYLICGQIVSLETIETCASMIATAKLIEAGPQ